MRRVGWHLKSFAGLYRAGRLTLYGKINAAFHHIARLYARMCMPSDCCSLRDAHVHDDSRVTWHRAIYLRQNLSGDPRHRWGRSTLSECLAGKELTNSANRAARDRVKPRRVNIASSLAGSGSQRSRPLARTVRLSQPHWQASKIGPVGTSG
jgi:hypothetical protein